jgi:heat shock protein HslJ
MSIPAPLLVGQPGIAPAPAGAHTENLMHAFRCAIAAIVAAAWLVAGNAQLASGGSESVRSPAPSSPPDVTMAITEVEWHLVRMHADGVSAALRPASHVTLRIAGDGTASGSASVNRYRGTVTPTPDGVLRWGGPLRSTQMAGAPELMEQERAFLAALLRTSRWRLDGDELALESADGSVRLLFRR